MNKKQFSTPPRRVALFVTCMVDMLYPEIGIATVELLERHGVEVIFPEAQTCCGQPAFNAGYRDEARLLAGRFLDIFEPLVTNGDVDAIVAPSGSCTTMTTHFYPVLFENNRLSPIYKRAQALAEVTFELTEFLVDVLGVGAIGAQFPGKVAYHACCHLLRELKVDAQPRELLSYVEEAELVELPGAEECCGFGGLFAIKQAGISTAMGQRKTRNIAASDADIVTLCDVSCMTHINGLLQRQAQRARAVHIAEVLNNQIDIIQRPAPPPDAPPPVSRRWQDARE
ncbi:MAG: (Fe-S)-binding protein [Caldilineaceae bacterium]|nr:(Fe-S)-binding protein [Caldilineaceae bacterium]